MTKSDFVKASKGEFSKTQQINYSTVLYLDLTCFKWPTTALRCPSSGEGRFISHLFFLLLVSLFINLVISLFVYLFILIFINFSL